MKISKNVICPLNCPDTCQLIVEIENNKILNVVGDPQNPYTRGTACPFINKYVERVYSPYRILHPHRREGDTYQTWIQTDFKNILKDISNILKKILSQYPSSSILHIQGKERGGVTGYLNKYFFKNLGGVTTIYEDEIPDMGQIAFQQDFGYEDSSDPRELLNSKLIILWNHNPFLKGEHYLPFLNQAHKKGAKIILISPIYSPAMKIADAFYQPKPGTEGIIAAILSYFIVKNNWYDSVFMKNYVENGAEFISFIKGLNIEPLIKHCEISATILENLARLMATQKPVSSILGEELLFWENSIATVRLINALHSILGQIGESGAGVLNKNIPKGLNLKIFEKETKNERKLNWTTFVENAKKLDPPIMIAFINRANPVNSLPAGMEILKILREIPYVIYFGSFLDDTSEVATHFLPITSIFEEKNLIFSHWHKGIGINSEVIMPRGEAKSEFFYYQRLARLLEIKGFDFSLFSAFYQVLKPVILEEKNIDKIVNKMILNPKETKVAYSDKKFLTPSSKIQVITHFDIKLDGPPKNFPLYLYPVIHRNFQKEQIFPDEIESLPLVAVNPEILKDLKKSSENDYYIFTKDNEIKVKIAEDEFQRKDVVLFSYGRSTINEENVNLLLGLDFYHKNGNPLYFGNFANIVVKEK